MTLSRPLLRRVLLLALLGLALAGAAWYFSRPSVRTPSGAAVPPAPPPAALLKAFAASATGLAAATPMPVPRLFAGDALAARESDRAPLLAAYGMRELAELEAGGRRIRLAEFPSALAAFGLWSRARPAAGEPGGPGGPPGPDGPATVEKLELGGLCAIGGRVTFWRGRYYGEIESAGSAAAPPAELVALARRLAARLPVLPADCGELDVLLARLPAAGRIQQSERWYPPPGLGFAALDGGALVAEYRLAPEAAAATPKPTLSPPATPAAAVAPETRVRLFVAPFADAGRTAAALAALQADPEVLEPEPLVLQGAPAGTTGAAAAFRARLAEGGRLYACGAGRCVGGLLGEVEGLPAERAALARLGELWTALAPASP